MSEEKILRTARLESCDSCDFWIDKHCHRYPPIVIARVMTLGANVNQGRDEPEVDSSADSEWPETGPNDWCGEWQSKFRHIAQR